MRIQADEKKRGQASLSRDNSWSLSPMHAGPCAVCCYMKTISQILVIGVALLWAGCATNPLPRNAKLVGGGLLINWSPPKPGTAILIEKKSGKIMATRSVSPSDGAFEFDPSVPDFAHLLRTMFDPIPADAEFALYFVSDPKE